MARRPRWPSRSRREPPPPRRSPRRRSNFEVTFAGPGAGLAAGARRSLLDDPGEPGAPSSELEVPRPPVRDRPLSQPDHYVLVAGDVGPRPINSALVGGRPGHVVAL